VVEIKGLEKFAPKDFPGHMSATVFVGGCNFLCPFCHNADLVSRPQSLPTFPQEYLIRFFDERKDWLEGICISGGEPLIHDDLGGFLKLVKEKNFLSKIDTNGSYPFKLKDLIDRKLIDFVAMDIKAPLDKYSEAAGVDVQTEDIQKSVDIIKESEVECTFRSTAVPGLIDKKDMKKIGEWLDGAKIFQLQQFIPKATLDSSFQKKKPYLAEELEEFADIIRPYVAEVRIEGV
jgi:pyruvate formate lyase activating enzyme